jgi:hypothetical protein
MTLVILWWFVSAHKWFKGPLVIPFFFFFFFFIISYFTCLTQVVLLATWS